MSGLLLDRKNSGFTGISCFTGKIIGLPIYSHPTTTYCIYSVISKSTTLACFLITDIGNSLFEGKVFEMNVLFYLPVTSKIDARIQEVVEMARSMVKTEIFRSIGALSSRLRRPIDDFAIAFLLAGRKKELLDIVSICHLLSDIPVILILPDRQDETIAAGYKLYPRFLTYMDSNLTEVGVVLEKMILNTMRKKM
jgi:hypothetical protein